MIPFRTLRRLAYTIAIAAALLASPFLVLMTVWSRPQQGVARFHSYGLEPVEAAIAEDEWADPLILTGRGAVAPIVSAITDRKMPRRGYAIWYLGLSEDRRALPALETIVNDPTESQYARGDALEAIAMIDEALGMSLARRFESHASGAVIQRLGQATSLERAADSLLYLHVPPLRRSYLDAFRGRVGVELRL